MSEEPAVKAFAVRLCDAMRRKGMTSDRNRSGVDVAALAKACGLSYEMTRRYVEGRAMPRSDALETIAKQVGRSASWLAYGVENRSVIDGEILEQALLAVSEAQKLAGITLSPGQAARVVAKLYEESRHGDKPSASSLSAVIKALLLDKK